MVEDIWFEIFKQLPVKTLGKCRCVCKSWRSLIVSPTFMAAHLKYYTQNNANSLILYTNKSENGYTYNEQCVQFRDLDQLKEGYNNSLHSSTSPASICDYSWPYFPLFCSVYGLLCLSDFDNILIWNPILEKCITLPRLAFRGKSRVSVVGFGYDCRKNDHRVVVIYYSPTETPLVEVFSVQERTRRIISADYLVDNSITRGDVTSDNCFVNGVIHWFNWDAKVWPLRPKTLLLFNVSDDKFDSMELPEAITNMEKVTSFCIFEHQGMLSVSHCDSPRCQIWVKREYNDATSWFKILDVNKPLPSIYPTDPMQFMGKNGEPLVFTKKVGDWVVYLGMTMTGRVKELGFGISQSTRFSAYSESLVFLDQETSDYIDDYAEL